MTRLFYILVIALAPLAALFAHAGGGRLAHAARAATAATRVALPPPSAAAALLLPAPSPAPSTLRPASPVPFLPPPAPQAFFLASAPQLPPHLPPQAAVTFDYVPTLPRSALPPAMPGVTLPHPGPTVASVLAFAPQSPPHLPLRAVVTFDYTPTLPRSPTPPTVPGVALLPSAPTTSLLTTAQQSPPHLPLRASFVFGRAHAPAFRPSAIGFAALAASGPPVVASGFTALTAACLVRDALVDGTLNPRNPAWRPHLALLLSGEAPPAEADTLFSALLKGCAGHDERVRLAAAESWAAGFKEGRFAAPIAYHAARRALAAGDSAAAVARCDRAIASGDSGWSGRAALLLALARAQTGDLTEASRVLHDLRASQPSGSDVIPEARFMEAWIALQDSRTVEAAEILRDIRLHHPRTPAAAKAVRVLADLEATQ